MGKHRKPISVNQLANQLHRFNVSPGVIRVGDETTRGYLLDDFREAFSRFLPSTPFPDCNNVTMLGKAAFPECNSPGTVLHAENELLRENVTLLHPEKGVSGGANKEAETASDEVADIIIGGELTQHAVAMEIASIREEEQQAVAREIAAIREEERKRKEEQERNRKEKAVSGTHSATPEEKLHL